MFLQFLFLVFGCGFLTASAMFLTSDKEELHYQDLRKTGIDCGVGGGVLTATGWALALNGLLPWTFYAAIYGIGLVSLILTKLFLKWLDSV